MQVLVFSLILISTVGHSKESCLFESQSSKKPGQYIQFVFFTDHTKHTSRFHFTLWLGTQIVLNASAKIIKNIILCKHQTFIGMAETEEVLKWRATD